MEPDKAAILQEILELTAVEVKQEDDITVDDYAKAAGVSTATARNRMMVLVEAGKLETLKVYDPQTQRQTRVWRKRANEPH